MKPILKILPLLVLFFYGCKNVSLPDTEKRSKTLEHLLKTFSSSVKDEAIKDVPIWESWLRRTGELPPDFDKLKTNAYPPDLLTFENGKKVSDPQQWTERNREIKQILQQYMLGNWPPAPEKIAIKYHTSLEEDNDIYSKQLVRLYFAPSAGIAEFAEKVYETSHDECHFMAAYLDVELNIPKVKKPFPAIVIMGSFNESRDLESIKRGYLVAAFNKDQANLIPAVYTDYECNQLEWWAFAASRCVDLLFTRDDVDKSKIAVSGHSRGGKTAHLTALMDERVSALILSHPGTGAGSFNLWRYAGEKYGGENLDNSTRRYAYWNNPRMRFFIGRENKMPFDNHFLLALAAPRPVLMCTGERDHVGQPWGDQQCYLAIREVYQLLGEENKIGFLSSPGGHTVTPEMVNSQLDWLDMQFGRKPFHFPEKLIYSYSFDEWEEITGEELDPDEFPDNKDFDILAKQNGESISTKEEWEIHSDEIKKQILRIIGELPAYKLNETIAPENETEFINPRYPSLVQNLKKADLQIDEKLIARLSYPSERNSKLPVVIYLHAYLDASGYNWSRGYGYLTSVGERIAKQGFLAVEFDQFGYASRNRDSGIEFYKENPDHSALGVMIRDVSKIIDAVSLLDWVDKENIMIAGYSLGATVALYSAVFDNRIKAVATTCGFGSMRLDVHGNQTEGIKRYSHLRPTIPRLGLFLGNESRIPYDYHDILSLIAPRPVLILAPKYDQDWFYEDVGICFLEAQKVYGLYNQKERLNLVSPDDFNRYPPEYQIIVNDWLKKMIQ